MKQQTKKSQITLKSAALLSTALIAGNALMGPATVIVNAEENTQPTPTTQTAEAQSNQAEVVSTTPSEKTEVAETPEVKDEVATPETEVKADAEQPAIAAEKTDNEVAKAAETKDEIKDESTMAHVTVLFAGPEGQSLGSTAADIDLAGSSTDMISVPEFQGKFRIDDTQQLVQAYDGGFAIKNTELHPGENVITVQYGHHNLTGHITIMDNNTYQVLESFDISQMSDGSPMINDQTGETVDVDAIIRGYESKGYVLTDNNVPNELTDPTEQIGFGIQFKHGIDGEQDDREVTRTIVRKKADGTKIDSQTQGHTFTKTTLIDRVTKKIVSVRWSETSATLPAVDMNNLFGYTSDKAQVNAVEIDPDYKHLYEVVTYTPNKETAKVVFKDIEDNKVLSEQTITGDFDTKSDFNAKDKIADYVSKNLVLVDNQVKDGINFDFDGETKTFVVSFKHKHTVTTETKDVDRTVNFKDEAGKTVADSVKQHVRFSQDKDRDEFTGKTNFSGWKVTEGNKDFAAINVDKVYGFSTDETNFPAVTVDENTKSENHDVVYHANDESITVKFLDTVTGEEIAKPEVLEGKFGETAKLTSDTIKTLVNSEGYAVQANPFDKGVTFDVDGETKVVTVKFGHQMNSETVERTVKRNFHLVNAETNKVMKEITQSITFNKTFTADLVTGEVTETEWASKDKGFAAVNMPTIKGFKAEKTKFAAEKVDPMQVDKDITVLYTPVKETAKPEQKPDNKPGKGTTTDLGQMGDVATGDNHVNTENKVDNKADNTPSKGFTTDVNAAGDIATGDGEITPESKAELEATPNTKVETPKESTEATDNEDVQTGVETNNFGVIGAIMAASASLLGAAGIKLRKRN